MDFKFPDVGEGIHEAVLVQWHVKNGDTIKKDDVLCEVETDKAIVEIPSPENGIIDKIYHKEGETVHVGDVLVSYKSSEKKEEIKEKKEEKPELKTEEVKDQGGVVGKIVDADSSKNDLSGPLFDAMKEKSTLKKSPEKQLKILPALRKKAVEIGVDINTVTASGVNGEIVEEDILKASGESKSNYDMSDTTDRFGEIEYEKLSSVRKTISRHLRKTFDLMIPVSQTHYCDLTLLASYRKKANTALEKDGYHFTFMPFICMALVDAIKEFPRFNAEYHEESESLILKKYVNLGFAVDTDKGLFVPVIHNSETKDIKTITRRINDLVKQTKDRSIPREDLMGASVTITNYGSLGTVIANPVIYYPNTCVLGIGAIQKTVKLVNGKVEERLILPLTLSYDHRFNDGADTARFLTHICKNLEEPLQFNHGLVE